MLLNNIRNVSRNVFNKTNSLALQQTATITSKTARGGSLERPKPFPYREKRYGVLQAFFDKTTWRFDENSKIVVVEGPLASGKSKFAKALADELDMLYLRPVVPEDAYINEYGFDLRQLNDKLPVPVQFFDIKNFLEDPKHVNVANFQIIMLILKYSQYIDALAHLMNTGQGVVIERSCFSDNVFAEALFASGYISKGAKNAYYDLRNLTVKQLMKPHLVIYLDIPVSKVQENIQKRSISYESKSKALTKDYLTTLEKAYKEIHLPDISKHAELLVYDWSEGGDTEVVVEDIETIDFDRFEKHDKKLKDWRFGKEWDLCEQRIWYTSMKERLMLQFNAPPLKVPELWASGDDNKALEDAMGEAPGHRFASGFNADLGDRNLLFKTKIRRTLSPWFR